MDKINKSLQKLNGKERKRIKETLEQLKNKNFKGLQTKKLKGQYDVFRVRKGGIRIIYRVSEVGEMFILAIERRSEKTYKGF
jgi:mRNA-degrading endonuclease RelE of RelBE toxin-antitoxin system